MIAARLDLSRLTGERMKSFVIALAVALVAATSVPGDAYARRIGGGGAAGMQRSVPPRATPEAPRPTAPAAQPAGRRSRRRRAAAAPRSAPGSARSPASPPVSASPR